jgi:hypothetical protein
MPDSQRIDPVLVEKAAEAAFWQDDLGGHVRGRWTWDSIPEEGRENYRTTIEAALRVVVDELRPADCDADLEQAWRNGWGSALNFLRAANDIGTAGDMGDPEARRILRDLVIKWVSLIESLTDNAVSGGREIGLASRAHLERRPVEQGDTE